MMKLKYQALLLMISIVVAGVSFASDYKSGIVSQIDHKNRTMIINGKLYRIPSHVMRNIHDEKRVRFAVEYRFVKDGDDRLVIEIRRRK